MFSNNALLFFEELFWGLPKIGEFNNQLGDAVDFVVLEPPVARLPARSATGFLVRKAMAALELSRNFASWFMDVHGLLKLIEHY